MSVRGLASLMVAAALMSAGAGVAHAADVKAKPMDFTVRAEPAVTPVAGPTQLKMDAAKGRWGVTFNIAQPATRDSNWNDVAAGAYFRITPSLRVGGAVAIGDQQIPNTARKLNPDEGQPRVRLETAFKF